MCVCVFVYRARHFTLCSSVSRLYIRYSLDYECVQAYNDIANCKLTDRIDEDTCVNIIMYTNLLGITFVNVKVAPVVIANDD